MGTPPVPWGWWRVQEETPHKHDWSDQGLFLGPNVPVNPPGAVFYHLGPPGAPEAAVPPPQRQLQPPQLHLQVSALLEACTAQVWCWEAEMCSQRMTSPGRAFLSCALVPF